MTRSKLVGILGGMGPAATVDFYAKLVGVTPAITDQEHVRVAMWADPTVPSRQDALLRGGEDPTPWLREGVQRLADCGAELLVMPCNTAHAYMDTILREIDADLEFISIIDTTLQAVCDIEPSAGAPVGLLATDAALKSGIYQTALTHAGKAPILPTARSQEMLMQVVHQVKNGRTGPESHATLTEILHELATAGASTVVLGCTELSTLALEVSTPLRVLDPSRLLAEAVVVRALGVDARRTGPAGAIA